MCDCFSLSLFFSCLCSGSQPCIVAAGGGAAVGCVVGPGLLTSLSTWRSRAPRTAPRTTLIHRCVCVCACVCVCVCVCVPALLACPCLCVCFCCVADAISDLSSLGLNANRNCRLSSLACVSMHTHPANPLCTRVRPYTPECAHGCVCVCALEQRLLTPTTHLLLHVFVCVFVCVCVCVCVCACVCTARCLAGDANAAVDLLGDILTNASYDAGKVEAERSVILRENQEVNSIPEEVVMDYLHATAFQVGLHAGLRAHTHTHTHTHTLPLCVVYSTLFRG